MILRVVWGCFDQIQQTLSIGMLQQIHNYILDLAVIVTCLWRTYFNPWNCIHRVPWDVQIINTDRYEGKLVRSKDYIVKVLPNMKKKVLFTKTINRRGRGNDIKNIRIIIRIVFPLTVFVLLKIKKGYQSVRIIVSILKESLILLKILLLY